MPFSSRLKRLFTKPDISKMIDESGSTRDVGQAMELIAQQHLQTHGLTLVTRNFTCKFGEVDLIVKEQDTFVFVEVKYRQSKQFGGAIHAVSPSKQQKIIKTAQFYLQQSNLNEYNTCCRFDVVAIEGSATRPDITWLKNAF